MRNILIGILKETDYYGDIGTDRTIGVITKMDVKEAWCEDVHWACYRGGPCEHIVTCRGGCVTYKTGFGLYLLHLTHLYNSELLAIQRYR
jgi:hypothetical protein